MKNKRLYLLIPFFIIIIIFILIPLFFLIIKACIPVDHNISNWQPILENNFWIQMGRSILLGFLSAIGSLILGLPFAYIVARSKNKIFKIVSIILIVIPIFLFTLFKIFSIKILFSSFLSHSQFDGYIIMLIGIIYLNFPFMVIPLYSVFENMPQNFIYASEDLGYSSWKTFYKVIIPYALKAIFTGFATVFILSTTMIVISRNLLFEKYDQLKMIGNRIFEYAQDYTNKIKLAWASSSSFILILIVASAYFFIYLLPFICKKIKKIFLLKKEKK